MHRSFQSVGQGVLYTEVFRSVARPQFVSVYDCGSEKAAAKIDIPLI